MQKPPAKKFAIVGAGFWARFQLAAWRELEGAECIALCDSDRTKAQALADESGIGRVYDDAQVLVDELKGKLDFLDIITGIETHPGLVQLAAQNRIPVICQKPMAPTLEAARAMVQECRSVGVPFWVHENWRWQAPIQALKNELESGRIGKPFRARIEMISGFAVFENQPALRELEQFLIADLGSHLFDVARFLFGEVRSVYCQTQRVHTDIQGEDVATAMFEHEGVHDGLACVCSMAYAENFLEREAFPQTSIFIEGERGSIELAPGCWLRTTTSEGTQARRVAVPRHAWADPAYDVVHASIVPCNADILADLRGEKRAQTRGEDNLKTVELVFAAYESARWNRVVELSHGARLKSALRG